MSLRYLILAFVAANATAALPGAASAAAPESKVIIASPDGPLTSSGTAAVTTPLSLAGALQSARALRASGWKGSIIIHLNPGTYRLNPGITLNEADSGLPNAPLVIEGAQRDQVRITGSRELTPMKPAADDAVMLRLPPSVRQSVVTFDLKAAGVSSWVGLTERGFGVADKEFSSDLFWNGQVMTTARWPNEGYARMSEVSGPDGQPTIRLSPQMPADWRNVAGAWAEGYWHYDWSDQSIPVNILGIDQVKLDHAPLQYGVEKGERVFLEGFPEALDKPGEWYLDTQRGIAYLLPPSNSTSGLTEISFAQTVFLLDGTKHVLFRNLTLGESRGDLVITKNSDDVRIEGCLLRNAGRTAARITGQSSGVANSDIVYSGAEGVWLSGGDRKTLQHSGLYVTDNRINHFARTYRSYHAGIYMGGVGVRIEHNILSEGPHMAILFDGNDHYIGHNEIYNVVLDTGDAGAIYTGRDWTARGTIIEDNFFHDIQGVGTIGAVGVYLDDQISGITIRGNAFVRLKYGIELGGGSDNVITNNLFVKTAIPVFFDARGLTFTKATTQDPHYALQQRLRAVPFQSGNYAQQYPTLANIEKDGLGVPMRNLLKSNLEVLSGNWQVVLTPDLAAHQSIIPSWKTSDPGTVFAGRVDVNTETTLSSFELRPDSQWIKAGFQEGAFKDAGPRQR